MRMFKGLIAAAALMVSGQASAAIWTFELSGKLIGSSYFSVSQLCIDPVLGFPNVKPECGGVLFGTLPEAINFSTTVDIEAFTDTAGFSLVRYGNPFGDLTRDYSIYTLDGGFVLTNGQLTSGLAVTAYSSIYCNVCYTTTISGPVLARFISSSGGPGPIPEPATWLMLIYGFALIGGALRFSRTPNRSPARGAPAPRITERTSPVDR